MKLISTLILLSCVTLLSACATKASVEGAEVASATTDDRVCTREKKTGSNISRTVCRTQAQARQELEDAREMSVKSKHASTNARG